MKICDHFEINRLILISWH